MKFGMKIPGAGFKVQDVNMDFHYSDIARKQLPTAYERLLLDCMHGDLTLYSRGDAVEITWEFIHPILELWDSEPGLNLHPYAVNSWGPPEFKNLIKSNTGFDWREPCKNLSDTTDYNEPK